MACKSFIYFLTSKLLVCQKFVSRLDLQPGQKVLDVGCGIGGSAFYMIKVSLKNN